MIPLKVAFLWHQHQPLYRSPRNGRYSLPWVRLHGLKDYYDMAALAGEFPRIHLTFNIVPSLLDQLDDYVEGRAIDPALELARRSAADLGEDERLELLELFFSVPYRTLIAPYPRYVALFHRRGRRGMDGDYREALAVFRPEDLRDLQVWFHLAWCGPTLRRRPEVRELLKKGDGFTEDEKIALLDLQEKFLKEIVPIHRRLADEGIAEISTSPYYHPILPLLCDLDAASEAEPHLPLPDRPFRCPSDAAWHVREALTAMTRAFGRKPAGMWPAEGALSEQAIEIFGSHGVRWLASDEGVLRASTPGSNESDLIYRPYRVVGPGGPGPPVFFRDQTLSDMIGFMYATWPAQTAAGDFLSRLREISGRAPGGVASVILDGENAWEHYPDNGVGFLRALYDGLSRAEDISTVSFSQALAEGPAPGTLGRLRAGSWIGSRLTTWIGHPEKNKAWSLLAAARLEAERRLGPGLEGSTAFASLAAAEGSDWFWWFGEDHSSEQDSLFDASFRDLLRNVYLELHAPVPNELDQPIKHVRHHVWTPPSGPLKPTIDGKVSDYFEWLTAGTCDAAGGQGTMHQAVWMLRRIAFGTDGLSFFVRVDPVRGEIASLLSGLSEGSLGVEVTAPAGRSVAFRLKGGRVVQSGGSPARFAAGKVLEIELPAHDAQQLDFFVALTSADGLVQRLPRDGTITLTRGEVPDWSV